MTNRMPNKEVRGVLSQEEVLILSDKEIKNLSNDKLTLAKNY